MLARDRGLAGPPAGRRKWAPLLVPAAAMLLAVLGWKLFWFQTDDAYITFRYVSNLLAGYGLVWNPPPFRAVEGYTSFLWALLLAAVWRLSGLGPPRTACWLSLGCGLATLGLVWRALGRLQLLPRLARDRTLLTALALLGICTNRTFLTWLSSGLETQLFNLCFTWWLLEAMELLGERRSGWGLRLSAASALAALARPDGLLTVPATLSLQLAHAGTGRHRWGSALRSSMPLLAVAGHLLWRRATYGEWLPNTFYAKVPAPWPAMGWRYLASFVVENGIWVLLGLAAAAGCQSLIGLAGRAARLGTGPRSAPMGNRLSMTSPPGGARLGRALGLAVVLAHVSYYTLIVGGDHFEYRVWSYLIPLLFVSAIALLDRLRQGPVVSVTVLVVFMLASWPLPWLHWWWTKDLVTRQATHFLRCEQAGDFPAAVRPVVAAWDGWQAELIGHGICARHQEHKVFLAFRSAHLPARRDGARIPCSGHPVIADVSVGILGWVLPHVAVIDAVGLNDRVIAHTPLPAGSGERRLMAHERQAPAAYLDCFMPNVERFGVNQVRVLPRATPLTDDRIRACESRDWYNRPK